MPHAYTENQLVEQPAIGLFAELAWQVTGPPPSSGVAGELHDAELIGRETKGEGVSRPIASQVEAHAGARSLVPSSIAHRTLMANQALRFFIWSVADLLLGNYMKDDYVAQTGVPTKS